MFSKVWAGLDGLLLAAVMGLLCVAWRERQECRAPEAPAAAPALEALAAEMPEAAVAPPAGRMREAERPAVEGQRVSTGGRTQVGHIAKRMVASGWAGVPARSALDMREDGQAYEVLFALPEGCDYKGIKVETAGDVLTLTVGETGSERVHTRRIRIPCGILEKASVESTISNSVLLIKVLPDSH